MVAVQSPSSSESCDSPSQSLEERLRKTLQDESEFQLFMDWMFREFSSEVLLSVIELVQFQALLKEYGQTTAASSEEVDRTFGEQIVFYRTIPRSSIVHENTKQVKGLGQLTRIASSLYEKYIRSHSELEINIGSGLRDRWGALHSTNYPIDKLKQLNSVVSDCVCEMMKYIRQSFLRFDIDRK